MRLGRAALASAVVLVGCSSSSEATPATSVETGVDAHADAPADAAKLDTAVDASPDDDVRGETIDALDAADALDALDASDVLDGDANEADAFDATLQEVGAANDDAGSCPVADIHAFSCMGVTCYSDGKDWTPGIWHYYDIPSGSPGYGTGAHETTTTCWQCVTCACSFKPVWGPTYMCMPGDGGVGVSNISSGACYGAPPPRAVEDPRFPRTRAAELLAALRASTEGMRAA